MPGHTGGESETIIGRWMKTRGNRGQMIVATKVGRLSSLQGLSAATIRAGAEASLRRLATDYIDVYFAHADDPGTPLEETLRAFDGLVSEGKVRHIAASNYTAPRLAEALAISRRESLAPYVAVQPHYNLAHREDYEGALRDLSEREHLACVPYFALASGFLTGKYRAGITVDSPRAAWVDEVSRRTRPAAPGSTRRHSGGASDDGGGCGARLAARGRHDRGADCEREDR